jgi:hypothetical protein
MRFHLTYEGELLGANNNNTRAKHKHEIRKTFHHQLKRLWASTWLNGMNYGSWGPGQTIDPRTPLDQALGTEYQLDNYRFVPLVLAKFSLLCSIDILFLRSDIPGQIIGSGDIDNRLKTLFDALRMPANTGELGGCLQPDADESPLFYCLLQDDKLISHVSVNTDMLLQPVNGNVNDARLVLDVKISPYRVSYANLGFAG